MNYSTTLTPPLGSDPRTLRRCLTIKRMRRNDDVLHIANRSDDNIRLQG